MNHSIKTIVCFVASALSSASANAVTIDVLNTMFTNHRSGVDYSEVIAGQGAGVRGAAIPFSVPQSGRITAIHTAIESNVGSNCDSIRLSVIAAPILGRSVFAQPDLYRVDLISQPYAPEAGSGDFCRATYSGGVLAASGLSWALDAGQYWLTALPNNDPIIGSWYGNRSIVGVWASAAGACCANVTTNAQWVARESAMPGARIVFETPEPSTLALGLVGMLGLMIARRV